MTRNSQHSELQAFIERLGIFFGVEARMPRSVGRVLAYMLLCEPTHQSADQIAQALQLSAGAVSNAVNGLVQVGLLRKVTFPGDRHYYYENNPDGWREASIRSLKSVAHAVTITKEGLKISKNNQRLVAMHDMYKVLSTEVDAIVKRLEKLG